MDTLTNAYEFSLDHRDHLEAGPLDEELRAPEGPRYSVATVCDGRDAYAAVYEPVAR